MHLYIYAFLRISMHCLGLSREIKYSMVLIGVNVQQWCTLSGNNWPLTDIGQIYAFFRSFTWINILNRIVWCKRSTMVYFIGKQLALDKYRTVDPRIVFTLHVCIQTCNTQIELWQSTASYCKIVFCYQI